MSTQSPSETHTRARRVVIGLAQVTLLTALFLVLTVNDLLPTIGALALALGFLGFVIADTFEIGTPLEALTESWAEHRRYIAFSGGLFAFGMVIGAMLFVAGVDLMDFFLEMLGEELGIDEDGEMDPEAEFDLTAQFFIVQNSPPFLVAIFGAITLGILTAIIMLFNGVLIGNIALGAGQVTGFDVMFVLIAPHGIFELFALFLAAGVGFRLLHRFGQRIFGSREAFLTREYLYRTGVFVVFGWLILVLAAFIEAYVTIALAEFIFAGRL